MKKIIIPISIFLLSIYGVLGTTTFWTDSPLLLGTITNITNGLTNDCENFQFDGAGGNKGTIGINFSDTTTIYNIAVYGGRDSVTEYLKNYAINSSVDGITWVELRSYNANIQCGAASTYTNTTGVTTKYLRLYNFTRGDSTGNVLISEITLNQNLYNFDNCSNPLGYDNSITRLEFTLKDEITKNRTYGDIYYELEWADITNLTYHNYTGIKYNTYNISFCSYLTNNNLIMNGLIQYLSNGYSQRTYYIINETLTTSPRAENLYLLSNGNSTAINLYLTDKLDNSLKDYYGYLMRKNFNAGSYETVEVSKSDNNGLMKFNLVANTQLYRWVFKDNTGRIMQTSDDNYITLTTLYYSIDLDQQYFKNYKEIRNMLYDIQITNATGEVNFIYSDSSDISAFYCLRVEEIGQIKNTILNDECSTTRTNIITYILPNLNKANYIITGYVKTVGSPLFPTTLIRESISYGAEYRTYGKSGIFTASIFTTALATIGLTLGGLSGGIIFSLLGLGTMAIFNIISIPWIILSSIIILAVIIIWKIRA